MLIDIKNIKKILLSKKISIKGSFHLGAHECEELDFYNQI